MQTSKRGGARDRFRSHVPEGHGSHDSKRRELWTHPVNRGEQEPVKITKDRKR